MEANSSTLSILRASRAVLFANPIAGRGRALRYVRRVEALFRKFEIPLRLEITDTAEGFEESVRAAIAQNHLALFAMGGDGTFQALANAAYGADVMLGLLPSGGGNDFAAAAKIPLHPVHAADALVHGTIRSVDLVRARTADGRTRLYAGGGGIGLDAEAAGLAGKEYRRFPARVRYVASALHALWGFKPLEVRLEFPGNPQDPVTASALLAAALNTPTYGGGLRLAPGATLEDGLLHVVLVENLAAGEVLALLPRLLFRGELRTNRLKRWAVEGVKLTPNRPCSFHGDGEILGPAPVEIELAQNAAQILVPTEVA